MGAGDQGQVSWPTVVAMLVVLDTIAVVALGVGFLLAWLWR